MDITEVRIKLIEDGGERLKAFCSITFDDEFVVRDLKVIMGQQGLFVAMPSRKLTVKCNSCSSKGEMRSRFCSSCGARMPKSAGHEQNGSRMFTDIAHPINSRCRERIETAVKDAYEREKVLSQQPGYVCSYDDNDDFYQAARPKVSDSAS